jgi:hypothetical protein
MRRGKSWIAVLLIAALFPFRVTFPLCAVVLDFDANS